MLCQWDTRNKYAVQYYKVLKELFPRISFKDGRFLRDIRLELSDFAREHPNMTYEELVDSFGRPEDIVRDYLADQDFEYILACIKKKSIWKTCVTICLSAAIICSAIYVWFFYLAYRASKDAVVNGCVTELRIIESDDIEEGQ